jgi:hypothetical protein
MKSHSRVMVLACLSASFALAAAAWSQADSSAHLPPAAAAPAAAPDTAVHKHGMFGKLKGLAKNKTIQSVAKAAVCTAVPGGQYVVAAVDAHNSGANASTALKGAAGSTSCIPGMAGMGAGLGSKGLGTAGAAGAMGMAAAQAGTALQTSAMNGAIARASAAGSPAAGGAPTAASMQAMMTQMQTAAAISGDVPTEAAGQQIQLSGKPADELKKGKLVIKHIDWMRGLPGVSASTMSGFVDLITTVGQAIKESGNKYRVDIYMDKQYADADIAAIAPQRLGMIISVLQDRVQAGDAAIPGNIKKDKEQRVEIVKIK